MSLISKIIKPKSERLFDRAMKDGKFDEAVRIATEHQLDHSHMTEAANAWMGREWHEERFDTAAEIGTRYHLSKKRTKDAANRALDQCLKQKEIEKAHALIEKYALDPEKLVLAADKFYKDLMDAEAFAKAADIAGRAQLGEERLGRAVARAFKKAIREKDNQAIADLGMRFGGMDLDFERVRQAKIALMVEHLVGQAYKKAKAIQEEYAIPQEDVDVAFRNAADARLRYIEKLRASMVTKKKTTDEPLDRDAIETELRMGYVKLDAAFKRRSH